MGNAVVWSRCYYSSQVNQHTGKKYTMHDKTEKIWCCGIWQSALLVGFVQLYSRLLLACNRVTPGACVTNTKRFLTKSFSRKPFRVSNAGPRTPSVTLSNTTMPYTYFLVVSIHQMVRANVKWDCIRIHLRQVAHVCVRGLGHGPLTRYVKLRLRMRRERFPPTSTSKDTTI